MDETDTVIATSVIAQKSNKYNAAAKNKSTSGSAVVAATGLNPDYNDETEIVPYRAEDDIDRYTNEQEVGFNELSTTTEDMGISWFKAMFLIVNAALGGGLLNFPQAFEESGGIVPGNVVHIIFVGLALGSLYMLAVCASRYNCKTYQEVVLHCCSPRWGVLASGCISLYCFVTCITFIIIIGDQFDRVFASYVGPHFCHKWYFNRKFTMIISSILLIIPSCFKRIDGLKFLSYVGVFSILYLTVIIVVELFAGSYPKGEVIVWEANFVEMFDVIPTICFGYQCHVSSVPIYSCLKRKDSSTFLKSCATAIVVCMLVYTFSANCGYITFGSLVEGDVLLSYDAKKIYILIAVVLLALKSWTTYPILLFCVREAISDMYIGARKLSPGEVERTEPHRRKIIAGVLWFFSIIFAVFTPNINIVVKLLGSLAAVFIFVFPGLCYLQLNLDLSEQNGSHLEFQTKFKIGIGIFYAAFGIFTFGLAFSLGIHDILHPASVVPVCT